MSSKWLKTDRDDLQFEDTSVGRLKKHIWEASDAEIDNILEDFGIPTPSELTKPGTYVQTTIRHNVVENRKKNDIITTCFGLAFLEIIFTSFFKNGAMLPKRSIHDKSVAFTSLVFLETASSK